MDKLYSIQQIRQIEARAIQSGISETELMRRAGRSALEFIQSHYPQACKIAVVAGKGNNAGDGFVLAHLAQLKGFQVAIHQIGENVIYKNAALKALEDCQRGHLTFCSFDPQKIASADIIVDALLGIGFQGNLREPFLAAITALNQMNPPKISLDVPSGLDADNGTVAPVAVRAELTVCFIGLKPGLFQNAGREYAGKVLLGDLSLGDGLLGSVKPLAYLQSASDLQAHFKPRPRQAHKGNFGHVLVVAGNHGMAGAAMMTAEAAIRMGAGLVSVATRECHAPLVSLHRPEIMSHGVESMTDLAPLLERASVIALGNGLGQDAWARMVWRAALAMDKPMVIDADGLNLLSAEPMAPLSRNCVLTPHPGEAARLLHCPIADIVQNRFASLQRLVEKYASVAVLKGAGTWTSDGSQHFLCPYGNPGMASAGMGDVLSGMIAALLAQQFDPFHAASLAVLTHALAADQVAKNQGERGMLATDLFAFFSGFINPMSI